MSNIASAIRCSFSVGLFVPLGLLAAPAAQVTNGDIRLSVTNSTLQFVGGDGIELDEGGAGDVLGNVRNSLIDSKGAYCADTDGEDGPFDPLALNLACNDDRKPLPQGRGFFHGQEAG
jgi:hypothetical protein